MPNKIMNMEYSWLASFLCGFYLEPSPQRNIFHRLSLLNLGIYE